MYSAKSSFERCRPRRPVRDEKEEDEEENNDHNGPFAFVTKPTRLREEEDDEEEEIFLDHDDESHDEDKLRTKTKWERARQPLRFSWKRTESSMRSR